MKSAPFARAALLALLPISLACGQSAEDTNEGLRIVPGPSAGLLELSWWGRGGRIYFIEHSEDLLVWNVLPAFEAGNDAPLQYGLMTNAARFFTRVRWVNATLAQFQIGDHDGDGLSNADEASAGLNPFLRDSDGDGMLDGWELAFGLNPSATDGAGDLDGDGVRNDEDARPNNLSIGRLAVTILVPAQNDAL